MWCQPATTIVAQHYGSPVLGCGTTTTSLLVTSVHTQTVTIRGIRMFRSPALGKGILAVPHENQHQCFCDTRPEKERKRRKRSASPPCSRLMKPCGRRLSAEVSVRRSDRFPIIPEGCKNLRGEGRPRQPGQPYSSIP